ncbi:MAG: NAD(P)/FAD-dependent oxidoreductase, partial [Clostridia bacterium]|nr:NAD(P)/FAD-dependent oxidoreductase [Clostridia bacterium]
LYAGDLLTGYVHSKVSSFLAAKAGISKLRLNDLTEKDIKCVISLAKGFTARINGTYGFEFSQVTHGGIATADVDNATFESKLVKGLYIVGEALDIDGDCGGYNLQWAFSSARCAAESIL